MAARKTRKKTSRKRTKKTGRGPGRRLDEAELQRRLDILKRIAAGEINNRQAADELGMSYGSWQVWKSNQKKKGGAKRGRKPGRPRKAATAKSARAKRATRARSNGQFRFRYESTEELVQWVEFLRHLEERGAEVPFSIGKGEVAVG